MNPQAIIMMAYEGLAKKFSPSVNRPTNNNLVLKSRYRTVRCRRNGKTISCKVEK